MVDDSTKKGLLEWLFGKSSLDKAAAQGASIPPSPAQKPVAPPTQNTDYLKKQIDRKMEEEKAQKAAMDKLKKVQ